MRKRKRQIGREAASHGIRLGDVADEVVPVHETVQSEGEYDFSENASVFCVGKWFRSKKRVHQLLH